MQCCTNCNENESCISDQFFYFWFKLETKLMQSVQLFSISRIKHIQDEEIDFTDRIYQEKLPMVARSTASRAIKSNIKLTEIMIEPNDNKNRQKVTAIISMHMQRRLLEREQDPGKCLFQKNLRRG